MTTERDCRADGYVVLDIRSGLADGIYAVEADARGVMEDYFAALYPRGNRVVVRYAS